MLKNLLIKNYALIKHLEIDPSSQLNIITGETGAGKSIMLGALGLLLGNRADSKVLFDEDEKCVIEGNFDIGAYNLQPIFENADIDFEQQCLIRREITPSGKSRAFINDSPVTLDVLKQISVRLMDIHSQHDTLQLGSNEYQLQVVDAYAQNKNVIAPYREIYREYKKAESAYKKLITEAESYSKELDYNKFLLDELVKAQLDDVSQAELEQELEVLENAETIKSKLNLALEGLTNMEQGAEKTIKTVLAALNQISSYSDRYEALRARLESLSIELSDISSELTGEEESVYFDEEKTAAVQEKLSALYQLQKKHHVTGVEELIALRDELDRKVSLVLNLDTEIEAAQQKKEKLQKEMLEAAAKLTASRTAVTPKIEKELDGLLHDLGMPNAKMSIQVRQIAPDSSGVDEITFLFSANKGVKPETLKNVASGGEFSRLMLCIKYILAGKTALPTIIFDEIDTGISGEVAIKVGKMIKRMSERHQLFVISHLPQMAANGDSHYYVYKDNSSTRAISRIKKLSEEERISEIAQMIGGATPSKTAFENAKELLNMY